MNTAFAPLQMWEAEGGSQVVPADAATTLTPADEVLLRSLGSALLYEWRHVPRKLRRALIERIAAATMTPDTVVARQTLAQLVHHRSCRLSRRARSVALCDE